MKLPSEHISAQDTTILLPETDRETWFEERRKGVTATDIAAISGLNPWKTIYDVFLDKLDLVEPTPDNPAMKRGRRMEPVLAEDYAEMTGSILMSPGLIVNWDRPLMRGTPDRLILDSKGEAYKVLEIKTAGIRQMSRWGEPGTDDIPDEYICQVQWYMGITGLPEADVIVSIAGEMPQIYTVIRNDEMIEALYQRAETFWNDHVLTKEPPSVDESEAAARMLATLYQKADLDLVESDEHIAQLTEFLSSQKSLLKNTEDNIRFAENQIKEFIGDHEGVVGEWGKVTWRKTKDGETIDHKGIVAELNPPVEIIKKHTSFKPGYRRFLFKENKEGK
jgi:putative phage-type endonuclease